MNYSIMWVFSQNPDVDPALDVGLVFINSSATEGTNRPGLTDEYSDTLISNVAAKRANTIAIIHNAGLRVVDTWIENENVTAVFFAHSLDQDTLIELLYGRAHPSGKFSYTLAMSPSDYASILGPSQPDTNSGYSRNLISPRAS